VWLVVVSVCVLVRDIVCLSVVIVSGVDPSFGIAEGCTIESAIKSPFAFLVIHLRSVRLQNRVPTVCVRIQN
jgi:hypothetical protein